MTMRHIPLRFALIAGVAIASAAWAVNMQLGQVLPYLDCQHQQRFSAMASVAALLLTAAAAALSWRASRRAGHTAPLTATSHFIGALSALCALIFVFALSMQVVASLVLSGCER
jgi:uncharacterized membrane protein YqjE